MEKIIIKLYDTERQAEKDAVVFVVEDDMTDNIILKLISENINESASAESCLAAYQKLRDKLLGKGLGIRCKGSLINAVQSAMMSRTNNIYLAELGKQALKKDMVCIWDYCGITEFPDTEEQKCFIGKWRSSLSADKN